MSKTIDDKPRPSVKDRVNQAVDATQGSQAWSSIFRPGSIFRKGYTDSPRNRSYVIMNSVLYHLHPLPRRSQLFLVHPADRDRHLLDVLLSARSNRSLE